MKSFRAIAGLGAVIVALLFAVTQYGNREVHDLRGQVSELQEERTKLVQYAERLSASQRVAQVNVLSQQSDDAGQPVTTLRWQGLGANGVLGDPVEVTVLGRQVYFEALVIKFDHEHVAGAEPGRSTSLALFRRVFGELQPPTTGVPVGRAAALPLAVSDEPTSLVLWDRFWNLAEDPAEAKRYGVRIAQCEAPGIVVEPGQVWEVTLDAAGGLNLKRLDVAPSHTLDSATVRASE